MLELLTENEHGPHVESERAVGGDHRADQVHSGQGAHSRHHHAQACHHAPVNNEK